MSSINETKQLARVMGVLIALPCGIMLGVNTDLFMNKTLGDTSGKSLFPFPIFLFPVAIVSWVIIYKISVILSEKCISEDNHKNLRPILIVVNVFIIACLIVWKFKHPW